MNNEREPQIVVGTVGDGDCLTLAAMERLLAAVHVPSVPFIDECPRVPLELWSTSCPVTPRHLPRERSVLSARSRCRRKSKNRVKKASRRKNR